jgi:hypothetical protein
MQLENAKSCFGDYQMNYKLQINIFWFLKYSLADPSEEQLFNCLLELAQAHVNSPRSIRVASKVNK